MLNDHSFPSIGSFSQLKLPMDLVHLIGQAMNLPGIHLLMKVEYRPSPLEENLPCKIHTSERYKLDSDYFCC